MITKDLIADEVSLTTSAVASDSADTLGLYKHTIKLVWTPGTAANVLTVSVETRVTGGTWAQETTWEESATPGTFTDTPKDYQVTAADTSAVGKDILLNGHCDQIRVKYQESEDGSSTKGTITVNIYSSS